MTNPSLILLPVRLSVGDGVVVGIGRLLDGGVLFLLGFSGQKVGTWQLS